MKRRLLFLICIEIVTMFPKPGLQHKTYAEVKDSAKNAIEVNFNKAYNKYLSKYRDAVIKMDNKSNTLNLITNNVFKTINNIAK